MQTETLFRAARALETIAVVASKEAPDVLATFHGDKGQLYVILSGRPVGQIDMNNQPRASDTTLLGAMLKINGYAANLGGDRFSLVFVASSGTAAQFRVEAE